MMHSTLHFSLGMVVGTALTYRPLLDAWHRQTTLAPHLLRRAGVAHDLCEAWFMNIFLLSSALNRLVQGGTIYGPFVMGTLITAQYALLLRALQRARAFTGLNA